jgi:hypothetical protein
VTIAVPAVTPVITPADDVDAFALLLVHVPPATVLLSVTVLPVHTDDGPLIAAGAVFTVTVAVATQPVPSVYVMVTVPAVTPVTTPEVLIDAFVLLLLHVPPVVVLVSVVVLPSQTVSVPVIVPGSALMVTVAAVIQPVPKAYVIAVVPEAMPATTPAASIDALAGILLVQVPPAVVLASEVVRPWHTVSVPVIAAGNALTVAVAVVIQPEGNVYVMSVVAVAMPVTTPEASMVATEVTALDHVPPEAAVLSVVILPSHTDNVPVIGAGRAFTFTVAVTIQPVDNA